MIALFGIAIPLEWLADMWGWMLDIFNNLMTKLSKVFEGAEVTCMGSQAPLLLSFNIFVTLMIVIIIESGIWFWIGIALKRHGNGMGSAKKGAFLVTLNFAILVMKTLLQVLIGAISYLR